jgi:hypothetical protein
MRGTTGITSGTSITSLTNLSNGLTNSDVVYSGDTTASAAIASQTSLYSISSHNNNGLNAFTVSMQSIDRPGTIGEYYYAIRINSQIGNIYYGNIRFTSINLYS